MARGEPLVRQWNLLKVLQAHRFGICHSELAGRAGCSKRQVQRDLNVLKKVGFPVTYEVRDFGKRYWKLAPHFVERENMIFSVTELLSLFLSKQLLSPLSGTQFGEGLMTLLEKVRALIPASALDYFLELDETLLVKNVAYQDYSRHDKKIRILNQAIAEGLVVNLRYQSVSQKQAYSTAYHPYGLVFFDSNLYCIGFMVKYNEIRTLKIDRILEIELSNEGFSRPSRFSLRTYTQGSFGIFSPGRPQVIRIRLTGWAATSAREQQRHPTQTIVKDADKYVLVEFALTDTTEFKRWILGFGRYAKVIKPKSLAQEVAAELDAAAGNYT